MSEGAADSVAPTLADEGKRDATAATATATQPLPQSELLQSQPQPTTTTETTTLSYRDRRPRCGTAGGPPPSPYMLIDGRQLRSALVWVKKPSEGNDPPRRVSFPTSDSRLVTGYLEPANPWRYAENVSREDLIFAYRESCARHNTEPLQSVLAQLENLDISQDRCEELNLEGENLDQDHCEPLEEILKRVQFNKINLEGTSLNDESSIILFDMLEYYESAKYINISSNPMIGPRGWQACSHMIKKTQCLEQLEARDITFSEQYMNILSRALRLVCHLHVLKLENCGLSGRAIVILVTALKMNSGIRELYLADNGLDLYDAIQLGSLLRMNNHLQLLDISNNNVQDDGVRDILEGLINQVNEDKTGKGLSILVLWNNHLTKKSSSYISRIITLSKTLETLNIGQNMLTDETLSIINESLKKNRVLLQLGMQSTELTCDGIITLAEIMEANQVLQRIDLRDNSIQMRGMHALGEVMKKNRSITQIDVDDKPRIRIDGPLHQYMDLLAEIRNCCSQNEKRRLLEEPAEDTESPQHPSRQLNASSRKISLTCQTLPCSSRSAASLTAADEPAACTMLEPKRTSGGRLRSPAPSPIPSPVASPIPSPSRNRFVVCRVPEASLRSADSSAFSSPVAPSSLGSSPTCFFPGANAAGPSRFRVSVVKSVDAVGRSSSPKSVVTSPSGNVTIGFNFKMSVDSVDLDSASKTDATTVQDDDVGGNATASVDTLNSVAPVTFETSSSREEIDKCEDSCDEGTKNEEARYERDDVKTECGGDENAATIRADPGDETVSQVNVATESAATDGENTAETSDDRRVVYTSTKELHVPAYPSEEHTASTRISVVEDRASSSATKLSLDDAATESFANSASETFASGEIFKSSADIILGTSASPATDSRLREECGSTSVQRHKSSLEKLLSLFQYPSNFFSDSSNTALQDTRASLHENVSNVMALGDKLQQYLKESRAKIGADNSSSWSSEREPSRNRSVRLNVSQLQNLSDIFAPFKPEHNASIVEYGTRFFGQTRNQEASISEKESERAIEMGVARNDEESLLDREKSQITRSNGINHAGWEKNQIVRNDEDNSCDRKKSQIARIDETDCADREQNQRVAGNEGASIEQEKSQIAIKDEQNLFNPVNQISSDENNLLDRMKNRVSGADVKTLEDKGDLEDRGKKRVARNAGENFEVREENQAVEDRREDLQDRGKNTVASSNDEHEYVKERETTTVRSGEDSEDRDARDTHIDVEKDVCSAHDESQRTESDRSDRPALPEESVQSEDNFADRNLVLGDGEVCVASAAVSSSSSPASVEFAACVAARITDILPEYSVLELSQAECGDARRRDFERFDGDDEDRRGRDGARNLDDRVETCSKCDGAKITEDNDATRCLEGDDDAVGGTNAATTRRTCDTTTTDSINQTSDNNFSICNIARDRQVVDSVSTASAATTSASLPDNDGTSSLMPLRNVDASDHLNDEVTSIARDVASYDFTRQDKEEERKEEKEKDTAEVLDDACRDFAHCKSEIVNINLGSRVSETTNSTSESREDAPSEELRREHRSSVPNNVDVHRSVPEDAVDADKRTDPTILVTPYEITENLSRSDAEELVFRMTDISTDGTSVEDELSPGVLSRCSSNDVTKVADSYFKLPATTTMTTTTTTTTTTTMTTATMTTPSTITLMIENPESVHRNSQDSGIDETAVAMDDAATMDGAHPLPPTRGSLQESMDSGIESECSSICVRVEAAVERTLEASVAISKRSSRDGSGAPDSGAGDDDDDGEDEEDVGDDGDDDGDDGNDDDDDDFRELATDFLAKEAQLVDSNDSVSGIARSYLNSIKCAVVGTTRPIAAGMASGASLGVVIADEGVACPTAASTVIAHSPAAVHGTSPK